MSVIAHDKRYLVTRQNGITQPMMGKELAAVIAGRPDEITEWKLDLMPHEMDASAFEPMEKPVKATFPEISQKAVQLGAEQAVAAAIGAEAETTFTTLVIGAQPPAIGEARMAISELSAQLSAAYSADEMDTAMEVGRRILAGDTVIVKGRVFRAE